MRTDHPKNRDHIQSLRIWQWGTLIQSECFPKISDIDLAIEGIADAPTYFALHGDDLALTSFPLDIVQMEKRAEFCIFNSAEKQGY